MNGVSTMSSSPMPEHTEMTMMSRLSIFLKSKANSPAPEQDKAKLMVLAKYISTSTKANPSRYLPSVAIGKTTPS